MCKKNENELTIFHQIHPINSAKLLLARLFFSVKLEKYLVKLSTRECVAKHRTGIHVNIVWICKLLHSICITHNRCYGSDIQLPEFYSSNDSKKEALLKLRRIFQINLSGFYCAGLRRITYPSVGSSLVISVSSANQLFSFQRSRALRMRTIWMA